MFGSPYRQAAPVMAERAPGKITLYFHKRQTPPTLPYELHNHVSPDTWASRVPQILRLTARYQQPLLEAVWILLFFVAAIAVPMALRSTIYGNLRTSIYTAHFISLGIFLAIALVFWAPLIAWKMLGQQYANVLARRWAAEDTRLSGSRYNGYVPLWSIRLPGVLSSQTIVTINVPQLGPPTSPYDAQAYLPNWVGPAQNQGSPFEDRYATDLKRPSSLDALPLYDGRNAPLNLDEKAPGYYNGGHQV
ncbi:unnamed protein product [Peniophora sp. CBMAI 1063]|nr:unnamed protein product [Peniophora sp. CBMAI 1063]